jgi:hypothetical protein
MVWTDKAVCMPRSLGADKRSSMAANIKKGLYFRVLVMNYDNGFVANLVRKIIARAGYSAYMAGKEPMVVEDLLEI